MKIKGIKKCVGDYNWVKKQGHYSGWHAYIMFDKETSEIWTDTCYGDGYIVYDKKSIINLTALLDYYEVPMTMRGIKEFLESWCNK